MQIFPASHQTCTWPKHFVPHPRELGIRAIRDVNMGLLEKRGLEEQGVLS